MKTRISIFIIMIVMIFSLPVWAGTSGSGNGDQTQTQSRLQEQDQIRDQDQTKDQARQQLRDMLQITESARTLQQERLQSLEHTGAGTFADAQQHWAREQIASAFQWGFINGYQDGTFKPDGAISGTEGIIMMSRLMNCTNAMEEKSDTNPDIDLSKVPDWAREMMQEQTALRIASQSQFYGEEQLNRLQFAVTLAKALNLDPIPVSGNEVIFLDQKYIPAVDLGYINSLRTLGIVEGLNGDFVPGKLVTRAEAAIMLMRVVEITDTGE